MTAVKKLQVLNYYITVGYVFNDIVDNQELETQLRVYNFSQAREERNMKINAHKHGGCEA